ncbi:MAG: 3'-5' exoribonuclease domain-containing protein [Vulcanimicrobiaceae bacterium]
MILIAHEQQSPIPEIYVSTDIEANGPCPGLFSMLSFGMAAFTIEKQLVGTFSRNLELLPDADVDERTSLWWAQAENAQAYQKSRENLVEPYVAMAACKSWLEELRRFGRPIICGAPSGFDFTFIYYYFQRELRESPVGFASLDLRSYAAAVMKRQYRQVGKRQFPPEWIDEGLPHTHVALDDAIEQGCILINMLRANLGYPHLATLVDLRASAA